MKKNTKASNFIQSVNEIISIAKEKGAAHLYTEYGAFGGTITERFLKKFVFYIFLSSLYMSYQEDRIEGYNLDTEFRFEVYDASSISLLNPANSNAFQAGQIDIYYLVDGEKQKVYNGNYDYPENFSIKVDELTDRYVMALSPNNEADGSTTVTYIQWNEEDTDTVTCEFARGREYIITTRIVYNGQEVWSVDGENYPERRYFEIIK